MTRTTINVAYTSDDWRGVALSNFSLSPFELDGVALASVEGFIQGIKFPPGHPARKQAFASSAWEAKACGQGAEKHFAYWGDVRVEFGSDGHHRWVEWALRARFAQNEGLRRILASTRGLNILHQTGEPEPDLTSMPAALFCHILSDIRDTPAESRMLDAWIVEQTADALIYADRAGRIMRWNQAASRLFGFFPGRGVGRQPGPDHSRAPARRPLGRLRGGAGQWPDETRRPSDPDARRQKGRRQMLCGNDLCAGQGRGRHGHWFGGHGA